MRCCHPLQHLASRSRLLSLPNPKNPTLATFTCPPSHCTTSQEDLASLLQSCVSGETHHHSALLRKIHCRIVVCGLAPDVFLGNILLNGYSKSGRVRNARKLFDGMASRNLVSWSTLISMYAQRCYGEAALGLFSDFRRSSSESPNEFVLASVLRACTQVRDVGFAGQVHGFVVRLGFDSDVYVGTSLVNFYSKVGLVDVARLVFDGLPVRNSVTWTAIIAGCTQSGKSEASLQLFTLMKGTGVHPDKFVISSVISACSSLDFLDGGRQLHGYAYRNGVELDISVNNVLVDFYAKCYRVNVAWKLFDKMDVKNLVSWTTMIAGYMQNSCHIEAMELFSEMSCLCWLPDAFACTSVLTSCGSLMTLQQGKQVHAYVLKANLNDDDYVKNGLVDMYAKCNSIVDARAAFDSMVEHNTVSYNTIIEGYASQEELIESVKLFNRMRSISLFPNLLTFVSLLGVSASQGDIGLSKQIHGLVTKSGECLHLFSGSALVDVYSKCKCVEDARVVFEEMEDRDLVVWNAMIFGYAQNEEGEEALKLYNKLCFAGIKPNVFTFVAVVTAASCLASLFHGMQFHGQITKVGAEYDPHVSNALIDMYAKCGSIKEASEMFDIIGKSDVVCWNSMISRYADHGLAEEALLVFKEMQDEKIIPNHITFLGVLSACSHAGLVEDGLLYFDLMKSKFNIEPGMEHYACLVSLLGRAGRLYEAKEFIEQMPVKPSAIIWRSFLGACRVCGDVDLGKYAAKMAILMEPKDSGSYILLSNIFASKGKWGDVEKLRNQMDCRGVVKEPGYSWIELRREVHLFTSRDKGHQDESSIYLALDGLTKLIGDVALN